ncbi:MAG: Nif3-like dinuclear metal center hexameric protein [Clostridia bacterium]|nr:Nif3-like dinuclear metal center hexameric protein [Clostridia bacterium]
MNVRELYERISDRIPEDLSEEWDNDGIMCCPDDLAAVNRILVTLDVTEEIVDYAIDNGFDVILSHHPLVFKPLSAIDPENHISRKLVKLIRAGISVLSFHTRADKVRGGVNDCLARLLGLDDIEPFGDDCLGRIGHLECETSMEEFATRVKSALGIDKLIVADAYNPVYTIALVGGDGKGYVKEALDMGADTYLSGRIGYNVMEEAAEMGINLIEAGHYATEFPVTKFFSNLVTKIDPRITVEIVGSYMLRTI